MNRLVATLLVILLPSFAAAAPLAHVVEKVCVENAQSLKKAANAWKKLTGAKDIVSDPQYHPGERQFYIHGTFKPLRGSDDGVYSWMLLAPQKKDPISYCQITIQNPLDARETFADLVKGLALQPVEGGAQLRPLSKDEQRLGIDARPGEAFWTSSKFPGVQIKTDAGFPGKPSEKATNKVGETLLANKPKTSSGFVAVFIELSKRTNQ